MDTSAITIVAPADRQVARARPLSDAERERINSARVSAKSRETRRAYSRGWRQFTDYAERADWHGVADWPRSPAPPQALAAWLTELAANGRSPSTITLSRAAVSAAHVAAGVSAECNPARHPTVTEVMRGLQRALAHDQRQAKALDSDALARIEATAHNARELGRNGRRETPAQARWRGDVDIALARALHDAGLRRSEASALRWRDVSRETDRSGRITVPRGKNHAEPRTMYVAARTLDALDAIRPADADPDGHVFASPRGTGGLSGSTISSRIKSACAAAGLGAGYSGHSGRVGLARDMVQRGAPTAVVMRQGRWASAAMVSRYTRNAEAAEAARWIDA